MDNLEISFIKDELTPFDENQIEIPNDRETFEKEIKNKDEEIKEGLFSLDIVDLKDLEEKIVECCNQLSENKSKPKKVKQLIGIRNDYYELRNNYIISHKLKEAYKAFTKEKSEGEKKTMDEKLKTLMKKYEIHDYNEILSAVTYTENYFNQVSSFKRASKIEALVSELNDLKKMMEIAYALNYLKKEKEELLKIFYEKLSKKNISNEKDINKKIKELKNCIFSLKNEGKIVYARHFEFEIEELEELKLEAIELKLLPEEKIFVIPKKIKNNKDDEDDESIDGEDRHEIKSNYYSKLKEEMEVDSIKELMKIHEETKSKLENYQTTGKAKKRIERLTSELQDIEKYLRMAQKYCIEDEISEEMESISKTAESICEISQEKMNDFFSRMERETGSTNLNELDEYINGLKSDIENNKKIGKMKIVKELESDREVAITFMKEANSVGIKLNPISIENGGEMSELKRKLKEFRISSYNEILEAIEYEKADLSDYESKKDNRGIEHSKTTLEKYFKLKSDAEKLGLK